MYNLLTCQRSVTGICDLSLYLVYLLWEMGGPGPEFVTYVPGMGGKSAVYG